MKKELFMAGHGGQGVVLMGSLLARAAMGEGKEVTFFPTYGAEVRGGTANCSLIISTLEIASPVVDRPDVLVVMNERSLHVHGPRLMEGGLLFLNRSLIPTEPDRDDVTVIPVTAGEIAAELGAPRVANMVMLGATAAVTGVVERSTLRKALQEALPKHHHHLLDINLQAMDRGAAYGK